MAAGVAKVEAKSVEDATALGGPDTAGEGGRGRGRGRGAIKSDKK